MDAMTDKWGEPLTTASADAAESFAAGVQALATLIGDPQRSADCAIVADPEFILARCLAAYVRLYPMTGQSRNDSKDILAGLSGREDWIDLRTRMHLKAARAWVAGDLKGAIGQLEQVLLAHPRDLLAAKVVQDLYLFIGDSVNLRDSINRIFFSWPSDLPGYSDFLGMRSFGLEETYSFEQGEALGRQALSLDPGNVYARHSVTHVCEMLGRRREGIDFLLGSENDWGGSFSKIHLWWHLSLMYLDEGEYGKAKRVYDNLLCGTRPVVMHDIADRASLLWRFYLLGQDVSDSAPALGEDAQPFAGDSTYVFNEFHLVICEVLAGRPSGAESVLERMQSRSSDLNDGRLVNEVGIPFCRGLICFAAQDYSEAARLVSSIRHRSTELGGSHAQQDIVFQTALVAAGAAGHEGLTRALTAERVLTRPNSESTTARLVAAGREWRDRRPS